MNTDPAPALEAQKALGAIRYILEGTQPTHSTADTAIRTALEITAATLEEKPDMLAAQRAGLEFLSESRFTPAGPLALPPKNAAHAPAKGF